MLTALIMAGGKGTRFWPLSTDKKPKQFLNLIGNETMLQMTVNRILPIVSIDRIFICTGYEYVDLVKEQLPELPQRNIIIEPEGRNTAPCIALSSLYIERYFKDSNMLVLPADHLIEHENRFRELILKYNDILNNINQGIITFGIMPTRAEIGYGYIKGSIDKIINDEFLYKVERFIEKPNKEKAEEYLKDGNYLWNSGMFMWNTSYIIKRIKEYLPNTFEALKEISEIEDSKLQQLIHEKYCLTDKISIDYGILEKHNEIYVVSSDIGWDDVGSWEAIERYTEKDVAGNIHIGNINGLGTRNNLIIAANHEVIIDGLSNIYVVENDGKIVIGSKDKVSNIKELKNII